jgi:hypothetical protein
MFYTIVATVSYIARANMDGTNERKIIIGNQVTVPDGLTIDFSSKLTMYDTIHALSPCVWWIYSFIGSLTWPFYSGAYTTWLFSFDLRGAKKGGQNRVKWYIYSGFVSNLYEKKAESNDTV